MMWAMDLPVFGLSGEFWVHPRYLYLKYMPGPISLQDINLKILTLFWMGSGRTLCWMGGGGKKAPQVNSAIWCLTTMKLGRNTV